MGIIIYGPRSLKYPEGQPKSLHEYIIHLFDQLWGYSI